MPKRPAYTRKPKGFQVKIFTRDGQVESSFQLPLVKVAEVVASAKRKGVIVHVTPGLSPELRLSFPSL